MIQRSLLIYLVIAGLTLFLLRSKNAALREDVTAIQRTLSDLSNAEALVQENAKGKPSMTPNTTLEEETPPPAGMADITEPIVIPATISEVAVSLAEFYKLGKPLEKLGPNPSMDDPAIQQFMRAMPTMIGAFDVHEQALEKPEGFGSFMGQFICQILDVDADKIQRLEELYTKHRMEAVSKGLVGLDIPRKSKEEDNEAWLKRQESHVFVRTFRKTIKADIGVDISSIPTDWSVNSKVPEMKQVLQL